MKQLYTSAGQSYFDSFFKTSMFQFTGKRDDAKNTTTYEVSIPWTTLNTVSINGYGLISPDTTGFAALGGKPQVGTVLGLAYSINDTTGEKQVNPPDLAEGEDPPEYKDDEVLEGFWADQRHTVQWGSAPYSADMITMNF